MAAALLNWKAGESVRLGDIIQNCGVIIHIDDRGVFAWHPMTGCILLYTRMQINLTGRHDASVVCVGEFVETDTYPKLWLPPRDGWGSNFGSTATVGLLPHDVERVPVERLRRAKTLAAGNIVRTNEVVGVHVGAGNIVQPNGELVWAHYTSMTPYGHVEIPQLGGCAVACNRIGIVDTYTRGLIVLQHVDMKCSYAINQVIPVDRDVLKQQYFDMESLG